MKKLLLSAAAVVLLFIQGCGVNSNVTTAKDFISNFSKAYASGDVDKVMKMWSFINPVDFLKIDEKYRASTVKYSVEEMRADVEKNLKEKNIWYEAWKNTTYFSEEDRGQFIFVTVKVLNTYTNIVLIKENGYLRMHPDPNFFINYMKK